MALAMKATSKSLPKPISSDHKTGRRFLMGKAKWSLVALIYSACIEDRSNPYY